MIDLLLGLLAVKKISKRTSCVVSGKFALSFSLNFLSIFVHVSGSIRLITLIWVSLARSLSLAEVHVEYRWCQFWSTAMTSEVEERPWLITAGYGRHRSQWVNLLWKLLLEHNNHQKHTTSTHDALRTQITSCCVPVGLNETYWTARQKTLECNHPFLLSSQLLSLPATKGKRSH